VVRENEYLSAMVSDSGYREVEYVDCVIESAARVWRGGRRARVLKAI
jgi:hypothetical protein